MLKTSKYKYLKILIAIIAVISVVFVLFIPAFAGPTAGGEEETGETAKTSKVITYEGNNVWKAGDLTVDASKGSSNVTSRFSAALCMRFLYWSYGGLLEDIADSGMFEVSNFSPTNGNSFWKAFWGAYDSIAAVGAGLALMWMFISLIEAVSMGQYNTEFIIKMAIKFMVCCLVIISGKDAIVSLIEFGNGIFKSFKSASFTTTGDGTDALLKEVQEKMEDVRTSTFIGHIPILLETLIPALVMVVCVVIAAVQLMTRLFELGLRVAFAPIGIADVFAHGPQSSGMRYLKQLAGCAARGAAMYLVMNAGILLMRTDNIGALFGGELNFFSALGAIFTPVLAAVTTIGMMKLTDNILRDVFS